VEETKWEIKYAYWYLVETKILERWLKALRHDPNHLIDKYRDKYPSNTTPEESLNEYCAKVIIRTLCTEIYPDTSENYKSIKQGDPTPEPVPVDFNDLKENCRDLYDFWKEVLKDYCYECGLIKDDQSKKMCERYLNKINEYIMKSLSTDRQ